MCRLGYEGLKLYLRSKINLFFAVGLYSYGDIMNMKKAFLYSIIFNLSEPCFGNDNHYIEKLYNEIAELQVTNGTSYEVGGWKSHFDWKYFKKLSSTDVNVFSSLETMLNLESAYKRLPFQQNLTEIQVPFKSYGEYYRTHHLAGEPTGSVGFWPVFKHDKDLIRAPGKLYKTIEWITKGQFSLPADTDDSSKMALWLMDSNPDSQFITDYFINVLPNILDAGRKKQTDIENRWKQVNSGAFMTWIGMDKEDNSVCCVNTLNVLASVTKAFSRGVEISAEVLQARKDTTILIHDVIVNKRYSICSPYYVRTSQFFYAFAKHFTGELASHNLFTDDDKRMLIADLRNELKSINVSNSGATELAELYLSYRILDTEPTDDYNSILESIKQELRNQIDSASYFSYNRGNVVYHGYFNRLVQVNWYNQAYTASVMMQVFQ